MLHMHPDSHHIRNAVIHIHMPQNTERHNADRTLHDADCDSEVSIPVEISALTPTPVSPVPLAVMAVFPEPVALAEPEYDYSLIAHTEPKATGPPICLAVYSLRSPPA